MRTKIIVWGSEGKKKMKLFQNLTSSVYCRRLPCFCFEYPVKSCFGLVTHVCRDLGYITAIRYQ
jgi:hypothetical protein